MSNQIETYLKFANVQMAAEALLDGVPNLNSPTLFADGRIVQPVKPGGIFRLPWG